MPRQKAASLTIQWRISQKTCDRIFFPIFCMGTSCVALSIKNIKTRASREMTSRKKMGERCQALECGRARYLPSLIALLYTVNTNYFIHHVLYILYKYLFMSCPNVYCCILYI